MADNRPPAPQTPLPPGFLGRPFAHRGLHDPQGGAVENSLPAIEAACAAGYGIEIDLQLSADGVAMVFHDDDLARLTHEDGPVRARPATGLQAMALEGGDGATIPTLAEALALVRGRAPLLIELKDQSGDLTATDGLLEDATLRALDGYTGSLALMSFNPHMVAHLGRQAPQYPRGLTTDAFQRAHWPQVPPATRTHLSALGDLGRVGASFISHNHHSLDTPPVAEARAKGLNVLTWTIRSAKAEAVARKWADAITFEGYLP
ncbi:MAG: glycerophosphodiester phosphodiesterase family protein [Pseudomonadota bacterium]